VSAATLNRAVARLLDDPGFLRSFRGSPQRACDGLGLSPEEIEALKRGDAEELLALGLDPSNMRPGAPPVFAVQFWAVHNAERLDPVALLAAALLTVPAVGPRG
jgi:hypothetical protein